MVKDLLQQLRSAVEKASGLPAESKAELEKLVAELERQTGAAGTTEHRHGLNRLTEAVEGLEVSHPEITGLVNRIATALANVGI